MQVSVPDRKQEKIKLPGETHVLNQLISNIDTDSVGQTVTS